MTNPITLSVLVEIEDNPTYVWRVLVSLKKQTLESIEVFCLCGKVSTKTRNTLEDFVAFKPNYHIINAEQGLSNAANEAIQQSKGKYICFIEGSGFADFSYLETCSGILDDTKADIIKNNYLVFGEDGNINHHVKIHNILPENEGLMVGSDQKESVLKYELANCAAIYKSSLLKDGHIKFSNDCQSLDKDLDFNTQAIIAAQSIYLCEGSYLFYNKMPHKELAKKIALLDRMINQYSEEVHSKTSETTNAQPEETTKFKLLAKYYQMLFILKSLVPYLAWEYYEKICNVAKLDTTRNPQLIATSEKFQFIQKLTSVDKAFFEEHFYSLQINRTLLVDLSFAKQDEVHYLLDGLKQGTSTNDEILLVGFLREDGLEEIVEKYCNSDRRFINLYNLRSCSLVGEIDLGYIRGNTLVSVDASAVMKADNLQHVLKRLETADFGTKVYAKGGVFSSIPNPPIVFYKHNPNLLGSETFSVYLLNTNFYDYHYSTDSSFSVKVSNFEPLSRKALNISKKELGYAVDKAKFLHAIHFLQAVSKCFDNQDFSFEQKINFYKQYSALWSYIRQAKDILRIREFEIDNNILNACALPAAHINCNNTQSNPKLSVIMPVYNTEKYLSDCLDSILSQDITDIECICIDDGSSDNSLEVLRRYCEKDARVRIISQVNSGVSTARNVAIGLASGQYISFIDSDDKYANEKSLSSLYNAAMSNNAEMCGGSLLTFTSDGEIQDCFLGSSRTYKIKESGWEKFTECGSDYGWIRCIYKRSLLMDNNIRFQDMQWYEDPVFFVLAYQSAKKCYFCNSQTYMYRVDYKKTNWNELKVLDCLSGVMANMHIAYQSGAKDLFGCLVDRLNVDYAEAIMANLKSDTVFSKAIAANALLNQAGEVGYNSAGTIGKSYKLIRPIKKFAKNKVDVEDESDFE